jgi:type I restriction-modification system DNA methylase subunit
VQLPLPINFRPHRNRDLFADHYLNDPARLQALDEWKRAAGLDEAFKEIGRLYARRASRFNARTNEAQTENDFIRPVLNLLWGEDSYQVQVPIPNVNAGRVPDYALFRSPDDRQAAEPRKGSLDYWRDAPCLGDAKRWTAPLDRERGAGETPSSQIVNYLYRSRVRWGILTNGRTWRLYEREKSCAGGVYYEVDLEALIQSGDPEAFKHFYLFFRREAFLPDAQGVSFVEKVFQGSADHATAVGDHLKEGVYDALRLLMNGLFEHASNGLDPRNPEDLKAVHEHALILLYRILFLLYAEDRDLLPHGTEPYASYSLKKLQKEIHDHLRAGGTYPPVGRRIWSHLTNLFGLIDEGYPQGRIPAYNGGLFSPSRYPHIAHTPQPGVKRWEIGDHRLAEVVDTLAYQRERWDEPGTQDIDYNTLDVQHLGSIYEGLLELQPRVADEPTIEMIEDGRPVFKPSREGSTPRPVRGQPPRAVEAGEVYLVTNRGERKATGSYYTPKYVVDYIVQNTLGPLVDEAAQKVADLRPEVDKEIRRLGRKRREWKSAREDRMVERQAAKDQEGRLAAQIEAQKRRLFEPYLSLKILDPAMGSGHFLVGAADFLSLAMATDPNLPPLDEMGDEDPQAFCKRLVVERCLYGVDLNPLAVELAKLSLWLHTVSRDKALSFLDHHLRCGNSLIGARLEDDLTKEPPRFNARGRQVNADSEQTVLGFTETLTAKHLQHFLGVFRQIVETRGGDAESERRKDGLYRTMDATRDRFRAVASAWLAPYFGAPATPEEYQQAVNALRGTTADWKALEKQAWFQNAQAVARDRRFFHWELEFPEVFFDAHGFRPEAERGFDAVIGNPPYIPTEQMPEQERTYYPIYYPAATGKYDSSATFILKGSLLLSTSRRMGFIAPTTWQTGDNYLPLRKYFVEGQFGPSVLINLPFDVFPEAYIDTCIAIFTKPAVPHFLTFAYPKRARINQIGLSSENFGNVAVGQLKQDPQHRVFTDSRHYDFLSRFAQTKCDSVGDLTEACQGPVESFFEYADAAADDSFLPYQTCQVYRYDLELIESQFIRFGKDNPLSKFYTQPRILVRRIVSRSNRLMATCAVEPFVVKKDLNPFILTDHSYNLFYLLANINSKLHSYLYVQASAIAGKDDFRQTTLSSLQMLPIRRIAFTTPERERARLLEKGMKLYERCLSKDDYECVLGFVDHELSQTPERADVVHDLLASLSEQMIEMNRQRQEEVKGFLTWLERAVGAKVDDLANKTRIRDYPEGDLDALLNALRQNRRKLKIDPDARDFQEGVEREFRRSTAKLAPHKERIVATDRLIDLIVYRLYGLTEEEIAVVEGEKRA